MDLEVWVKHLNSVEKTSKGVGTAQLVTSKVTMEEAEGISTQ